VLAMLLQRYRLALVPNQTVVPGIAMRPAHGLQVRVHQQDRQFVATPVRGTIHKLVELP
jgi:hypothetical protein